MTMTMPPTVLGVLIGIVDNLEDPEKLGRIQVNFPDVDVKSAWAHVASPMAGKERGMFMRPEKGDHVLVTFLRGKRSDPYIIGSIWNQSVPPPPQDGSAKDNNWRFLRSRSGHLMIFDDKKGSEKITLRDKPDAPNQHREIVIDSANQKIQITCNPNGDIELKAPKGKISIEAKSIELKATGEIIIDASGTLTLKGSTVNIN